MLKNLKIGKRLLVSFLIAVMVSSAAGVIGVFLINKLDSDYSSALVQYGFAQGDLGNLGRHYQSQRVTSMYLATAPNEKDYAKYTQQLKEDDALIDSDMEIVKAQLITEESKQVYTELSSAIAKFRADRDSVLIASKTMTSDESIAMLSISCAESSKKVREVLDSMILDKSAIGNEISVSLSKETIRLEFVMTSVMVAAFIIAMALAFIISKRISRPIAEIEMAAAKMAHGNYDIELTYESRDELGHLVDSMRTMIKTTESIILDTARGLTEIGNGNFNICPEANYIGVFSKIQTAMDNIINKLSITMMQISMASDQVASGSDQVSIGAQALAQGATEQASSIEELSASILEITNQLQTSAKRSTSAMEMSSNASMAIENSNLQMQNLMLAMGDINEKSNQIGKIIKTIEDIAFQTNILALNAAVEAARAGAAGKGFAVVADEVRNLASKSSEAAKNTTELIEGSISAVHNGTRIANDTAKELMNIVDGSKETTNIIFELTNASNEQASAILQINLGVEQISAVVQTNSATSEESAAASEELSSQATLLKNLVGKFKLLSSVTAGTLYFEDENDYQKEEPAHISSSVTQTSTQIPTYHDDHFVGGKY